MISALLFVGLCSYLGAMKTDLKLQLKVIHEKADDLNILDGREFERNLVNEIKHHGRLYE